MPIDIKISKTQSTVESQEFYLFSAIQGTAFVWCYLEAVSTRQNTTPQYQAISIARRRLNIFSVTTGNLFCPFLHLVVIVPTDKLFCGVLSYNML